MFLLAYRNIHSFKDAVNSKRDALSNELADDDEDEGDDIKIMREDIEGEEDDGDEKFNEAGEVIEPFNMRNERDGGAIDDQMNYVFAKEKGEIDSWLAGMDEAAMEKGIGEAAEALRKRKEKLKHEEEEEEKKMIKSELELKIEILKLMNPGELVTATIRRLSGKTKASGTKSKDPSLKDKVSTSSSNRETLNRTIEIADLLMSKGVHGIYDMSYEAIEASTVMWEYQGLDQVIHGPFTSQQISEWKQQGFFTGPSSVLMRKVYVIPPDSKPNETEYEVQASSVIPSLADDSDDDIPLWKKEQIASTSTSILGGGKRLEDSLGGLKRTNDAKEITDTDEDKDPQPNKRVKFFDAEIVPKVVNTDLLADLDDDSDDEIPQWKKDQLAREAEKTSLAAPTTCIEKKTGPWVHFRPPISCLRYFLLAIINHNLSYICKITRAALP